MRDSADSHEYGVTSRGKRGKFDDYESVYAKRDRHLPRLAAEDAYDEVDGLPEGDRWSTWDQTENPIPKIRTYRPASRPTVARRPWSWLVGRLGMRSYLSGRMPTSGARVAV